jgi:hypothetical protein
MENTKEPKVYRKVYRTAVIEFYRASITGNIAILQKFVSRFGLPRSNELNAIMEEYVRGMTGGKSELRRVHKESVPELLTEAMINACLGYVKKRGFKYYVRGEKDDKVDEVVFIVPKGKKAPVLNKETKVQEVPKVIKDVVESTRQAPPSIGGLNVQATKKAKEKVELKVKGPVETLIPSDVEDFMHNVEEDTPVFKDFRGLCEVASKYGAKFILSKSLVANYKRTTENIKETYDKDILRSLDVQIADPSSGATSKDGAKFNISFRKLEVAYKKIPVIRYATKTVYAQGSPHMESLAFIIDEDKLRGFESEFDVNFDFKVTYEKLAETKLPKMLEAFHIVKPGVKYGVYGFKLSSIPFLDDARIEYFRGLHVSIVYSATFKQHLANQLKKLGKEVLNHQVSGVDKVKELHPAYRGKFSVEELEEKLIDPTTMAIRFEEEEETDEGKVKVDKTTQVLAPEQVYVGIEFIFPRINSKINLTGKKLMSGGEDFSVAVGLLEQVCLPKDRGVMETYKKSCRELQGVYSSGEELTPARRKKIEKTVKTCATREASYKTLLHYKKSVGFLDDDISMGIFSSGESKPSRGFYTYTAQVNSPLGATHYKELGFKLRG